ncbi:MAG: HEAT repeat domain-containing protein [Armatimonadetes bacterium]|nr:HEAT repeat domain-containing protein [Armatimonadota bacterium]
MVRSAALRALIAPGFADTFGSRAAEPPDRQLRRLQIAEALAETGDPSAVPPLCALLGDTVWQVRRGAARGLARLRSPRALARLAAHLSDSEEAVRDAVMDALVAIGAEAGPVVARRLEAREETVRAASAAVLQRLGWEPATSMERVRWAVARHKWDLAAAEGEGAVEVLCGRLRDGQMRVRIGAEGALCQIGMAAAPALVARLGSGDDRAEEATARILAGMGPAVLPVLAARITDPSARVRGSVLRTLTLSRQRGATPYLCRLLADEQQRIRAAAVIGLRLSPDRAALAGLRSRLHPFRGEPDPTLRLEIRMAIAEIERSTAAAYRRHWPGFGFPPDSQRCASAGSRFARDGPVGAARSGGRNGCSRPGASADGAPPCLAGVEMKPTPSRAELLSDTGTGTRLTRTETRGTTVDRQAGTDSQIGTPAGSCA